MVTVGRSITLDKDVDDFLRQDPTLNASALINLLLKEYMRKTEDEPTIS